MRPEETAVIDDTTFPNGPWVGFYTYGDRDGKHRMDLELRFHDGLVDGTGIDDVAPFRIRGHYDRTSMDVTWHKTYSSHDVWYRGFREGRGIWGVWEMPTHSHGGFQIWPKGIEGGEHAMIEEETPVPESELPAASPGTTRMES